MTGFSIPRPGEDAQYDAMVDCVRQYLCRRPRNAFMPGARTVAEWQQPVLEERAQWERIDAHWRYINGESGIGRYQSTS